MRPTILLIALTLMLPTAGSAASQPEKPPHWSVEIKGGWFYPAIDNWETFYGRDNTWHYAGSLAYKMVRQVEIGIEGGYIKDSGQGYAPLNNVVTGRVIYELAPLNVFAVFRGVFSERQWMVPYAGGGWTRMFYKEQVDGQATVRGSADGYHGRAGLQLLLDDADSIAARNLYSDFGIRHTYFFVETQLTRVTVGAPSVDIGGTSYLMGLLFEF
jgi:hypothetical protein